MSDVNLPKSIRGGYRDFTIVEWNSREAVSASRYGECDKMQAIIRVDTQWGQVKAANTLLHEVMHAVYDISKLQDDDKEERIVAAISSQLTQVWRDNPEFVAFMSECLSSNHTGETK